jgi:hypothetical protein
MYLFQLITEHLATIINVLVFIGFLGGTNHWLKKNFIPSIQLQINQIKTDINTLKNDVHDLKVMQEKTNDKFYRQDERIDAMLLFLIKGQNPSK